MPVSRLHQLLQHQAQRRPDAPALLWQGQVTSFADLAHRVGRLAAALAAWQAPGQRIAILAWNCPDFLELIYAASAAGHILVPLNARLAPAELAYQLRTAKVCLLIGDDALLRPLRQHPDYPDGLRSLSLADEYRAWLSGQGESAPPATRAGDPAWILYTSGTTGRPKGAILTHDSFLAGLRSASIGRPVEPNDRYFYPFPLFHIAAHNVLLQHRHGACVVLSAAFDAGETLAACRELGVTTISLAPTMIAMLLEHPDYDPADLAGVRAIGYGASAMPLSLLQRLLSQTELDLCQSYGMTELSGSVSFLTPEDHRRAAREQPELLASVGRPLASVELELVDEAGQACPTGTTGEIVVRGAQCMQGYWQDPDATAGALKQGWLYTGDIGRFDAAGYLYIVDRKKDMIISGGENIASREVEEVLRRHSAVADCAAIGLPHPIWGQAVSAVVRLSTEVPDEELEQHCRQYLAGFKTPRRWIRSDALPVNAGGKIDKALLRRTLAREFDTIDS